MDGATAIEDVFLAALEFPAGDGRARYLDGACQGDAGMRRRVERLLDAHPKANSFLEQPAAVTEAHHPGAEESGTVVAGRYKLLELVGEGGMGAVWFAEQIEPVRRKVALKVVKPGLDSKSVLARFEAERQALALMDHPNVAKVLDGGMTEQGRPFFVMEYVKGSPITEYCDKACLSVDARLRLFVQVCEAVQHAHQKGIIHRDLKPSNILVAPYDDRPVPRIIDFGLAKALHQPLTERTLFTAHGAVLGTPLYMSPEQAQLNNLDVDTRADVYSLGVLLYELLTGTTPVEKQRLQKAAWDEVQRIIRDEDPPRPSTRLSTLEMLPAMAACRQTEPATLAKQVSGDLDWIAMKCLEKDRARRYESAAGLARDLQRFLSDEPVEARPPSSAYRLRKLAQKHRAALVVGAALVLLLVAGTTVSMWQALRATRAERHALKLAAAETEASERAQKRLAQVEKGNEILASIFADFDVRREKSGTEPLEAVLAGRLLKAAKQLGGDAVGDPVTVARLQHQLGQSLINLGHAQAASPLLEEARASAERGLGADHADVLAISSSLATSYASSGRLDRALPLQENALKVREAKLGRGHRDTLASMNNLAESYMAAGLSDRALPLFEECVSLSKSSIGAQHPDTLVSMGNLATAYRTSGKLDAALPLYEQVFQASKSKRGADHPDTLTSLNNLAQAYRAAGMLDRALPLLEESLRLSRARLGSDHPETLTSMGNLASAFREARKHESASRLQEETLNLSRARLGADHPDTLTAMNNLAGGRLAEGKPELALPLLEESLRLRKAKQGADHPDTLAAMNNLAAGYQAGRKLALAMPLLEEGLRVRKERLGASHPDTLTSMSNLAAVHQAAGRLSEALPLLEEALTRRTAKLGPEHPETLISLNNLAGAYVAGGQLDRALPLLEQAAVGLEKRQFRHEHAPQIMTNAIGAYAKAKQHDKSEAWRRKWLAASASNPRRGPAP
jgi:serine/threonine protein kinase/tetratricopeptide (TPR) repeat protein